MIRFPYLTRRKNKPGYKGVRPSRDKFIAQVFQGGQRYHLGTYATESEAAWAVVTGYRSRHDKNQGFLTFQEVNLLHTTGPRMTQWLTKCRKHGEYHRPVLWQILNRCYFSGN